MAERTGGELLAESLIQQGVTRIFGIPGVQLDDAADALYARADRIGFTCARNEQATTYMADGYARSTGDVGVAMVVPGPGVLNALSGVATGYSANSPMLLIAGQIDSRAIGKGLAKTGTAPCEHLKRMPGDGLAVWLWPEDQPRRAILVREHGVPGSIAAKRIASL